MTDRRLIKTMASDLSEAIRMLVQDKGIAEDLVLKTIEDFLLAAYKKKYGTVENAVVRFSEDGNEVTVFAKKKNRRRRRSRGPGHRNQPQRGSRTQRRLRNRR